MLKRVLTSCWLGLCLTCGAVEVNTANEAELDSVRGLGPSSTARILKAREQGAFKDWGDLMERVKGIKPGLADKLSAGGLTVNDVPFVAKDTGGKLP